MSDALPQATTDLSLAKSNLDEFGYALISNAMTSDEVSSAKTRLAEQIEGDKQLGIEYRDSGPDQTGINQRVRFLINKGQIFRDELRPQ